MKKFFAIFLVLVLVISMVACNKNVEQKSTDTNNQDYRFTAKILEKYESSLLLEVTDSENSNISKGSQATIVIKSDYPECKIGDPIIVVFDGVVLESYPLQIPNVYSVTLVDK